MQPFDAGIINSFKAHYRKLYLQTVLEAINSEKEIPRLNIKEAINLCSEAWRNVTTQTIVNCWRKTEIVPLIEWNWQPDVQEYTENPGLETDIEQLISDFPADSMQVTAANHYIHFDDTIETEEVVIDEEEIIEEILQTSNSDSSNEGSDIEIEKFLILRHWSSANYFCSTWNSKTQLNSYKNKTCQDCKVYCDVFNRIYMRRDNKKC